MNLEPFHQGRVVRALMKLRWPTWSVLIGVFGLYWVVPLAIILASDLLSATYDSADLYIYVNDYTHLLYAALISVGASQVYVVIKITSPVVRHTLQQVIGRTDHHAWRQKYRDYQSAAFSQWLKAGCWLVATVALGVLVSRAFDDRYLNWWGHISHGPAGLYFAIIASQMVFWGSWSLMVVAAVSMVISHIARCRFDYAPLKADG